MITQLDSYHSLTKKIDNLVGLLDSNIPGIFEMDKEIESILEIARMHNVPGIEQYGQSLHALLYSIAANARANRAHYIALKCRIDALNKLVNLSHYS